ncbi:MAG: ABC transporter permease [Verrucomicrobia bacterium]|nr:ABC transporter permease [Verrucomicrobiota bacterium]
MNGFTAHLANSLRLHFRNKMALLYGYLFPLIFLAAFWVLYRYDKVPLLRHMGELLTVSVLGGACFGLPSTMVSERERGVWRRYRLVPVPTWSVVLSTIVARYVIVLSAGLLQLGVALAVGMTLPAHPLGLFIAFTAVSFAFIGLGLVIAMMADTVPAVQALGQCIFLPMLIIGGVAVQLASLPLWAQHVSAFFPGRYAVEALQASVTGGGLGASRFSLLALGLIGAAGCVAGAKLFRWDAQQRFAARTGKAWVIPVLLAWAAVGGIAEWRGRIAVPADAPEAVPAPPQPVAPAPLPPPPPPPQPWEKMTDKEIALIDFRVPPDGGVVSPMAPEDDQPEDDTKAQVDNVREGLRDWPQGKTADDVQNVRYLLCVAAVPDAIQMPVERYLPRVVLQHLTDKYPKEKLIKLLTWVILHPEDGEMIDTISDLGVQGAAGDPSIVRERAYLYAIKFLGRLTGKFEP